MFFAEYLRYHRTLPVNSFTPSKLGLPLKATLPCLTLKYLARNIRSKMFFAEYLRRYRSFARLFISQLLDELCLNQTDFILIFTLYN